MPISRKFTTESISTNSLNAKSLNVENNGRDILEAFSNSITAYQPVHVKSNLKSTSLDVIDGSTQILKAESTKVTINMPTTIKGTDSNLIVAGKGSFGGKLTVTTGGADITGATDLRGTVGITGKTTIGADETLTEIENDTIKTSKITIEKASNTGSLVIDKTKNNIIEIKNSSDESIFYVNTKSGETFAKKINATVEGIIDKAANVTTSINEKSITDIFETNGLVVQKASSLTATSSTDSAGNIIITGNTAGKVDALIPAKTKDRTYNIGSSAKTFDNIYATTFHGSLDGNAKTASAFETAASITLEGDVITSTAATGIHGWTVNTIINDKAVTNAKLANSSITIGSKTVILGDSIGTSDNPFNGTFYAEELLIYNKNQSMMDPKNPSKVVFGEYNHGGACVKIKAPSSPNSARKAFSIENYTGSNPVIEMYGDLTTSPSYNPIKMRIIADSQGLYGHTDFYGNKISIYSEDYNNEKKYGTLEAGTVDLSASSSNTGLKIAGLNQIKVNGAGLKSSTALQILATASSADEDGYEYVQIGNNSQKYSTLRVTGLSEFTRRATFSAGISVTKDTKTGKGISVTGTAEFNDGISVPNGTATFENGISVTGASATFEAGISVSGDAATFLDGISVSGASATFLDGINVIGTAAFGNGISVTGTAEATTFNAKSDRRLKENIIDYKPEKSILDLPIKKFDFIDGPKNQIGCIAQDLKEICPEIVNENEKGYLSIQESKLVYLLLDEVKKLKNEVEELKRN